jgi:crotonobetaine/carnitine-CoA ligase
VNTVGQYLHDRAQTMPDRVAIDMIGEGSQTYSECYDAALRLARGLISVGVRPGDSVVIMAPNCLRSVHAWLGANLAGAVDVTINTAYRAHTLEHAINIAGATIVIAEANCLQVLRESEAQMPLLKRIVYFQDGMSQTSTTGMPKFARVDMILLDNLLNVAPSVDLPSVRSSDVASVIYTSGTTGPAKGVMMPHAQVCALAAQSIDGLRLTSADVFYCFHPLFHMAGKFMAVFATLIAGGRVVLDRSFKAESWVDRVRDHGATVSLAHGPMVEMIHAQPPRPEDSQHAVERVLAAPFPKAIARAFETRFNLRGIEVWGMTEVNIGTWQPYDEPLRLGSCGKVSTDWVDLRIVGPDTDMEVPLGTVGEIVVRPRRPFAFMLGYIGMPEKTVEAWRNLWFHTGDMAYMDADDYCYFVDRIGDRIRRRAENISSYEIETAAAAFSNVAEAAAVGIPSEFEADDDIKLCLVPKAGVCVVAEEVITHLIGLIPHYMIPRFVEILPALPRTPTNKVKKAELRARGITSDTWDRKAAGVVLKDMIAATRGSTTERK